MDERMILRNKAAKVVRTSGTRCKQPKVLTTFVTLMLSFAGAGISHAGQPRPRMVVLTDVSTWETEDSEFQVQLMVHADLFEILSA